MGDALRHHTVYSFAEYEAQERAAQESRYEYYNGEVWSLAGGSNAHNQIVQNIAFFLRNQARDRGCRVRTETAKLEVAANKKYFYPDVMLTCSPKDIQDNQFTREPELLVEVLSDSTENKDLGKKADAYLSIPTLKAYLIVAQDEVWIRIYIRQQQLWTHYTIEEIEKSADIPELFLQIPLSEVYADVNFSV